MPFCTNCGTKLEGIENYCPYCGKLFENVQKVSEPSTGFQIEALKNEVSSLRRQLEERSKPIVPMQEKKESECWKCCCVVILMMMLMGFLPWIIFF